MIWQQPWAWVGAAAVLLPVLIHLLGFGRAPRYRFPTLRFIEASRLLPTRRTRIHDPWLLMLRALILLAAVAALAQPLVRTAERRVSYAALLARVVVLDTSASSQRAAARAGWGSDSSRSLARALADSADIGRVIQTSDVEASLVGASHWLRTQPLRREIVVLSDFQVGVMDSSAVGRLPGEIGLQLVQLDVVSDTDAVLRESLASDTSPSAAVMDSMSASPTLLMTSTGAAVARAAFEAARQVSGRRFTGDESRRMSRLRDVAIVSADFASRDSLLASSLPVQSAWMLRLLHEVRSHALVVAEGATDARAGLVSAAQGERNGQPLLLLLLPQDATSTSLLSIMAALNDVMPNIDEQGAHVSRHAGLRELESAVLPDSVLRSWQREPALEPSRVDLQGEQTPAFATAAAQPAAYDAPSDARWLWALVLVLLGVEAFVRGRLTRAARVAAATHEDAADAAGLAADTAVPANAGSRLA